MPPGQQLNNRVIYADDPVGWSRLVSNPGGKDCEYAQKFRQECSVIDHELLCNTVR